MIVCRERGLEGSGGLQVWRERGRGNTSLGDGLRGGEEENGDEGDG